MEISTQIIQTISYKHAANLVQRFIDAGGYGCNIMGTTYKGKKAYILVTGDPAFNMRQHYLGADQFDWLVDQGIIRG